MYDKLLTETKAALPNIKFVLGEPFFCLKADTWTAMRKE